MTATTSVLLVEDEPLIAMMLEDFLESLGHAVAGVADCVDDALALVDRGGFGVAILDVHLRDGAACWPIADALADAAIPYIISTGGHVDPPPARHADTPRLSKPFTLDVVREALESAIATRPQSI